MIVAPELFSIVIVPERKTCTLCRETQPEGLMGAMKAQGQHEKVLCDRCLCFYSKPLGLSLQGIRLMRQAAALRLGGADRGDLAEQLMEFSIVLERLARESWLRDHPKAKVDCEHCLLEFFTDHSKTEADDIRAVFLAYQRLRFKLKSRDLFIVRYFDFDGISEERRVTAIEHFERFLDETGPDQLCSLSNAALHFLGKPVGESTDPVRFPLPATHQTWSKNNPGEPS